MAKVKSNHDLLVTLAVSVTILWEFVHKRMAAGKLPYITLMHTTGDGLDPSTVYKELV